MINTYNESDLHKELKHIFCPKNGQEEVSVLDSICDIFYGKNNIIEIQTANLSALRLKLEKFLPKFRVKIVYPIILNSNLLVLTKDGSKKHIRKSPKHGNFFQVFRELSGLYHFCNNKNLSLTIVYIESEVIKQYGVNKKKRNKNRACVINKKLLKIVRKENYKNLLLLCTAVLDILPNEFTNKDLEKLGAGKYASYTSWFLKKTGFIFFDGKLGRYNKYCKTVKSK